jgi:CMP/dCMP kinase
MSALQLNRHSERDADIDAHLDGMQRDLARSGEPLIVDSRLGWYFFADAFKVHLKADPTVAAARVMARQAGKAESYRTLEEAGRRLRERSESERARFLGTYGVDKARLRNYSLVCDTTQAWPSEVVDAIIATYERDLDPVDRPILFLDPAQVLVTSSDQTQEPVESRPAGGDEPARQLGGCGDVGAVRVGYARTRFFAVAGHAQVRAAVERGDHLIEARLVAEVGERPASGPTA